MQWLRTVMVWTHTFPGPVIGIPTARRELTSSRFSWPTIMIEKRSCVVGGWRGKEAIETMASMGFFGWTSFCSQGKLLWLCHLLGQTTECWLALGFVGGWVGSLVGWLFMRSTGKCRDRVGTKQPLEPTRSLKRGNSWNQLIGYERRDRRRRQIKVSTCILEKADETR